MDDEIRAIEEQITALKKQLSEARRRRAPEPIGEYNLETNAGTITLDALFGAKEDLLVIHNMGASCSYCTLWADGLSGLLAHIEDRTDFVVVSPDIPSAQSRIASFRFWNFRMASDAEGTFTREMGFLTEDGNYWPGVSAFKRGEDGTIVRTGSTYFGPGDDFCAVWPLFDLLEGGDQGWQPKNRYLQGD